MSYLFTDTDSSEYCQSPTAFKTFASFEFGIVSVIYFFVGISIILSKCKLAHVAKLNYPGYSCLLWAKFFLMSLLILTYAISLIMSLFVDSYWTNACDYPYLGLLYLLPLAVLLLAVHWTKYQYERKIPLQWQQNQLFWILCTISYAFILISCYFILDATDHRSSSPDFILVLTRFIIFLTLAIVTTARSQDRVEFDDNMASNPLLLDTSANIREENYRSTSQIFWSKASRSDSAWSRRKKSHPAMTSMTKLRPHETKPNIPLTVTVSSKVQQREDLEHGTTEIVYRLHVKVGSREYKIGRTINDFKRLENSILKELPSHQSFNDIILNAIFSDPEADTMANVSSNVSTLQTFLDNLIGRATYIPIQALTFLEIPEPEKSKLLTWAQACTNQMKMSFDESQDSPQSNNLSAFDKVSRSLISDMGETDNEDENAEQYDDHLGSFTTDNEILVDIQDDKSEAEKEYKITKSSEEDYCYYFNVNVIKFRKSAEGSHIEYVINLQLVERPEENWQIVKRYSDFMELRNKLRQELKNTVPPKLPKKIVVKDEHTLEERRHGLEKFLRHILNEKVYFIPTVFEFIQLKEAYYDWVKEEEDIDFSNYVAVIDKNQIILNNSKPYTIYHVRIEERSPLNPKITQKKQTIYRRFKEFDQLDQALKRRFQHSKVKLPELPPKYNAFSNKTTVDFRQEGLQRYLNELFQFPNIGDSFAFRKFINFKRRLLDSFIVNELDIEGGSSPNKRAQDISDIAIEEKLSTARRKRTGSEIII